ncbi:MAG: right-handed parallel beta-helix repeat-containing protein [Polyangiaceae bacterium]
MRMTFSLSAFRGALSLFGALALCECGDGESSTPSGTAGASGDTNGCGASEVVDEVEGCAVPGLTEADCDPRFVFDTDSQRCIPKLPEGDCPKGTMKQIGETTCVPVGPTCTDGFVSDNQGGCAPVLPAAPCTDGEIAFLGESSCHPIVECDGAYLPNDLSALYVDRTYDSSAGPSDGSQQRPWLTIQAAIDHANSGDNILIAAGVYTEDVKIYDRTIKLWGVCPDLVTVVGSNQAFSTIDILNTSGSEVHGLSIKGTSQFGGIGIYGAQQVLVDRVRVAENKTGGVLVQSYQGNASATISHSLIEKNQSIGIISSGANVTISEVIVQNTLPASGTNKAGRGIDIEVDPQTHQSATGTLSGVVVDATHEFGVFVLGSNISMERSWVHHTQPRASDQKFGRALSIQQDPTTGVIPEAYITSTVLDHQYENGIYLRGAHAKIDNVVVSNTSTQAADGTGGWGIDIENADSTEAGDVVPSEVQLSNSLVDASTELGVALLGANLTVDRCWIRNTVGAASTLITASGIGSGPANAVHPANLTVTGSLIEHNSTVGITISGTTATVTSTTIRDTQPNDQPYQIGIGAQIQSDLGNKAPGNATFDGVLVEDNIHGGVSVVGASFYGKGVVIRRTEAEPTSGRFGGGLYATFDNKNNLASTIELHGSVIDQSTEVGMLLSATTATVSTTSITRTRPRVLDQRYGRGVNIQANEKDGRTAAATFDRVSIADNLESGMVVSASPVTLRRSVIRATHADQKNDEFGDGLWVVLGAELTVESSLVQTSQRAGLSLLGATASLASSHLDCNAVSMNQEDLTGLSATDGVARKSKLTNLGGNLCSCGDHEIACTVQSNHFAPPDTIETLQRPGDP